MTSLLQRTATIISGQQDSSDIDLGGDILVGIQLPAAFTGATLTFKGAETVPATGLAGTFQVLKDEDGGTVTLIVAQGTFVQIPPGLVAGVRFLRVRSGSAEGGNRTLYLTTRPGG